MGADWQTRPHEGLRHPFSLGQTASPNDDYAALIAAAGYVPVTLTGEDYIELLPAQWRAIGDTGVQIDYRTYNSPELRPLVGQSFGVANKNGRWEVHYVASRTGSPRSSLNTVPALKTPAGPVASSACGCLERWPRRPAA